MAVLTLLEIAAAVPIANVAAAPTESVVAAPIANDAAAPIANVAAVPAESVDAALIANVNVAAVPTANVVIALTAVRRGATALRVNPNLVAVAGVPFEKSAAEAQITTSANTGALVHDCLFCRSCISSGTLYLIFFFFSLFSSSLSHVTDRPTSATYPTTASFQILISF